MCIKSAIFSFPLILYVCPKSTFLPSSLIPPCLLLSLLSYLSASFLFFFLLSLCLAHCFFHYFLHFPVFLFYIHLASGVLSHSDLQYQTCQAWPWIGLFQSVVEGTEDSSKRRQYNRWMRSFISALCSIMLFYCCCFIQWESGVAAKTYKGSNGSSSCSVNYWKVFTTKK